MTCFVTGDETWICHYDPKVELERLQWTEARCSGQYSWSQNNRQKGYGISFLGYKKIDYLEKGKKIYSDYYCNLPSQMEDLTIEEIVIFIFSKSSIKKKKNHKFHLDNIPTSSHNNPNIQPGSFPEEMAFSEFATSS